MTADPQQLRVFKQAGSLGGTLFEITQAFPSDDPYCLQSRIRQATTHIPVLIVRAYTEQDPSTFRTHILAAMKEASELRYLVDLAHRMAHLNDDSHRPLDQECALLLRALHDFLIAPDAEPLTTSGSPK